MSEAQTTPDDPADIEFPSWITFCPDGTFRLWDPKVRTGIAEFDFALGERAAIEACDIARLQGSCRILALIQGEMIATGRLGFIEEAFLREIAARTYIGSFGK